jgi:hypothetical protein
LTRADIVIVGTGIHGMHMYVRLGTHVELSGIRVCTVDPAEAPLALWKKRTANTTMKHLRSPASHGIHPRFPRIRRLVGPGFSYGTGEFIRPYHRPSLALFNQHSESEFVACSLERTHVTGVVRDITLEGNRTVVSVRRRDGSVTSVQAAAVILAPGQPPLNIPAPFNSGSTRSPHIYSTRFSPDILMDATSIAIVGCGIAGTHLAITLAEAGVSTDMWCRSVPETWQFDSDPCFIGPRCGEPFRSVSGYSERRRIIGESRRSGSVPPDLARRRDALISDGVITLRGGTAHSVREFQDGIELGDSAGTTRRYDCAVLATGFAAAPPAASLINRVGRRYGLPRATDGYPIVDGSLRWHATGRSTDRIARPEEPRIYCMGALAELEVGPPGRNIIGAHLAGRRITADLIRTLSH